MNKEKSREIIKNVGADLLNEGRTIRIKAHGYSMYPSIKPGTNLFIEPLEIQGEPLKGEIIAIWNDNGITIHRLTSFIEINGVKHYITRGDNNSFSDEPVTFDRIAGRITGADSAAKADISIRERHCYFYNRIIVILIRLSHKLRKAF